MFLNIAGRPWGPWGHTATTTFAFFIPVGQKFKTNTFFVFWDRSDPFKFRYRYMRPSNVSRTCVFHRVRPQKRNTEITPNAKLENTPVFQLWICQMQSWKTPLFSNFGFGRRTVLPPIFPSSKRIPVDNTTSGVLTGVLATHVGHFKNVELSAT